MQNSDRNTPKVLVIVPAFNEATNILAVVQDIEENAPFVNGIIVVNDGSTDTTEKLLIENKIPHINLIENLGIGGAVQTGYKYALKNGYDIAVQFDGDGQHNARYIKDLITPIIEKDVNLTVGSRFKGDTVGFKSSFMRRIGINILSIILKMASTNKIEDVTSGFRAADREAIKLFAQYYPADYPEPESLALIARKGLSVYEVPVSMRERAGGVSSIRKMDSVYYMIKVALAIMIQTNIYERRND